MPRRLAGLILFGGLALAVGLVVWSIYDQGRADGIAGQSGQPVSGMPINRGTVNGSTTITTGNTFQVLSPSNFETQTQRMSLTIENNNTNGDNCWLFIGSGTPTTAKSILLVPGGSYSRFWPFVPSDALQVTCATTSDTLYVDTQ